MAVKDNMNLSRNLDLLQNVPGKKSLFCQLFHFFDAFPVDSLSEIMNKWYWQQISLHISASENLKNTLLVSVVCEIKLANHNLDVGLQKLFWLEQITNISVIVNVGQFRGLNNIFPFLQLPLVQFLSTLITLSRSDYRVIKEPIPCYELRLVQIQKCVK